MSTIVEEICHTLAEFYPEPEERAQIHYTFAHHFFPQYFFLCPDGVVRDLDETEAESTRYVQARWQMMEQQLGLVDPPSFASGKLTFRRVMDLVAWKQLVADRPALFVEMPTPEQMVRAYFLALVLPCPATEQADAAVALDGATYITLERTAHDGILAPVGSPAILCAWTSAGVHHNFGTEVIPRRSEFVLAVSHLLTDESRRSPEEEPHSS